MEISLNDEISFNDDIIRKSVFIEILEYINNNIDSSLNDLKKKKLESYIDICVKIISNLSIMDFNNLIYIPLFPRILSNSKFKSKYLYMKYSIESGEYLNISRIHKTLYTDIDEFIFIYSYNNNYYNNDYQYHNECISHIINKTIHKLKMDISTDFNGMSIIKEDSIGLFKKFYGYKMDLDKILVVQEKELLNILGFLSNDKNKYNVYNIFNMRSSLIDLLLLKIIKSTSLKSAKRNCTDISKKIQNIFKYFNIRHNDDNERILNIYTLYIGLSKLISSDIKNNVLSFNLNLKITLNFIEKYNVKSKLHTDLKTYFGELIYDMLSKLDPIFLLEFILKYKHGNIIINLINNDYIKYDILTNLISDFIDKEDRSNLTKLLCINYNMGMYKKLIKYISKYLTSKNKIYNWLDYLQYICPSIFENVEIYKFLIETDRTDIITLVHEEGFIIDDNEMSSYEIDNYNIN